MGNLIAHKSAFLFMYNPKEAYPCLLKELSLKFKKSGLFILFCIGAAMTFGALSTYRLTIIERVNFYATAHFLNFSATLTLIFLATFLVSVVLATIILRRYISKFL